MPSQATADSPPVPPENEVRRIARMYFDLGFFPFQLPVGQKRPPLPRYTGRKSLRPIDDEILADIARIPAAANLGISLPVGTVAVDVDTYGTKTGGSTLVAYESDLGPLPRTWHSTRRGPQPLDGPERTGVYFFQLPEWAVPNPEDPPTIPDIGGDIEVAHYGSKYVTVAPSTVDDQAYRWYGPDGKPTELPPSVTELPILSDAWTKALLS